ncbi:hypothetical protein ACFLU5_01300 [Bacteroidota bacterium]
MKRTKFKQNGLTNAVIEEGGERRIKKRKERQKAAFKKLYNKTSKASDFPKKNINMNKHFYFPKFIGIEEFKKLPKNALSIYPVLCAESDFKKYKWFSISIENIACRAGVSPASVTPTVDIVLKDQYHIYDEDKKGRDKKIPLMERKEVKDHGRQFYKYRVGFIRKKMIGKEDWKSQFFIFYTSIIDSGLWAKLNPRAKALYLSMRTVAKSDYYLYCDIEYGGGYYGMEEEVYYGEGYRKRKWDLCTTTLSELCRMVNIERSNIQPIIQQLEGYRLIERVYTSAFMVYLKPKSSALRLLKQQVWFY